MSTPLGPPSPPVTLDEAVRALVKSIRPTFLADAYRLDLGALDTVRRLLNPPGQLVPPAEET